MDELAVRREYGVTGWATGITSLDNRIRQVMAPVPGADPSGRTITLAGAKR